MWSLAAPHDQAAFCLWRGRATTPFRTNRPQIAPVVSEDEVPAKSALYFLRCQAPQRLLKTVNRDDLQPVGIVERSFGVLPGRHQEVIHTSPARTDGLLLDAADRQDTPVERELARR